MGYSSVVEQQQRSKGLGFESWHFVGRSFFFSVNFMCWLYFGVHFTPCVSAIACKTKRSQSFCLKCRWSVAAQHTLCMWLWISGTVNSAWLYDVHRTCTETPAVLCGTSHRTAKQCYKYNRFSGYSKTHCTKLVTHSESCATKGQWVCSEATAL